MRKIMNIVAAAALVFGISAATFANTPVVNKRQNNQQQRIKKGMNSGSLTARETAKLAAEQAKIQHDEKMAKADGHVNARERAKLNHELNKTNKDIYRQKHDGQSR